MKNSLLTKTTFSVEKTPLWRRILSSWKFDFSLIVLLLILAAFGFFVLYSASDKNVRLINHQMLTFVASFFVMILIAQIPPFKYENLSPVIYSLTILMLVVVLFAGAASKGAQRWLDIGITKFQPSELVRISVPLMLAWYLKNKRLPPDIRTIVGAIIIIVVPMILVIKQPDLGTAILIAITGAAILFLAGISWKFIFYVLTSMAIAVPIAWKFMLGYQKTRILVFLNPSADPLKSGYNIIQSKIAIGSGGLIGKGFTHGSQSHLQFLPSHTTDFIFAVCGEEFGFISSVLLLLLFCLIVARGFWLSSRTQETFSYLLSSGLILSFFFSFLINIGMVIGLTPIVGLPLPLISYGGSSMVVIMIMFGLVMSVHNHRRLLS